MIGGNEDGRTAAAFGKRNGRDKRKQNTQAKGCYCIFIPAYGIPRFCIYLYFAEKLQRKYTGIGCRMEYAVR